MKSSPARKNLGFIPSHPRVAAIVVVSMSIVLTLLFLEIYFRSAAYLVGNKGRLEDLEPDTLATSPQGSSIKRKYQIKLSANPKIVYEHRPNLRLVDDRNNTYTINRSGFRGPDYPVDKGPSDIRIVGLGDSFMYGNGVSDEDIFMARLSSKLNDAYPEASWQLINTAVGGYNTVMEVETLKEKGLQYQPDIVLILFVGNDLDLPNFIREPVHFFAPRSFLVDWVRQKTRGISLTRLVAAPKSNEGNWFERDPQKVPAAYRGMVGPAAYRNAMHELKELSIIHGFELIVLQQNVNVLVTRTCSQLNLPLVRFQPALEQYMMKNGIEQFRGSALSISETDLHPSAVAHGIFGEVIFEYLATSGAIERALAR